MLVHPDGNQLVAWHRQELFRHLSLVADGIQRMLGESAEVVVHDFQEPEHSIVHIAGNVTGRQVGGSITDLGLELLESGDGGVLVYRSAGPDGRPLKSTSVIFHDAQASPLGALCVNIDVGDAQRAIRLLEQLVSVPVANGVQETYADDPAEVVSRMVRQEIERRATGTREQTRADRVEIVRALKHRGVFHLRNATTIVADELGVSRYSIYKYLGTLQTA